MNTDLSSGTAHADLSLNYAHHDQGALMTVKDYRVMLAEFVGTFFLALLICASKNNMNPESHPFAIGFGLVVLVYALGPVSGGQFNPAVTTGLMLRQKLSRFEGSYIIASQILGAIVAAVVAWSLYDNDWNNVAFPHISQSDNNLPAFVAEFLQTCALVLTVLNTATTTAQANNSYYGVAIGFTVVSGALVVGGVSGGCFNPAIACISLLQGHVTDFIIYVGAEVLAAIVAVIIFRVMNPSEYGEVDLTSLTGDGESASKTLAKGVSEFVGTLMLAYTIGLSGNATSGNGFIAIGAILTSMVYMGGAVSGAHFNPAVTTGVYIQSSAIRGEMKLTTLAYYMLMQLLGAFFGGKMALFVNSGDLSGPTINFNNGHSVSQALMSETLFTFMLVTTVMGVACCSKVAGNSYFGLAIGFAVLASASTIADVSGCALNPAIGVALPVLLGETNGAWVYIVGPILGAVLAGYAFLFWHGDDERGQYHGLR